MVDRSRAPAPDLRTSILPPGRMHLLGGLALVLVSFFAPSCGDETVVNEATEPRLAAEIAANPSTGVVPLDVQFVSVVNGADGAVTHQWSFGDAGSDTVADPTHTFLAPGNFPTTVQVTDAAGTVFTALRQVLVVADAQPAVALAVTPTRGTVPMAVRLDALATGGNAPLTYLWDFGDGGSAAGGPTALWTYTAPGVYTAVVTATDADGDTAMAAVDVAADADVLPTVLIAASPAGGIAPLTADLECTAFAGNPPLFYEWSFGDGGGATSAAASHRYTDAGVFEARCRVTDANGDVGTDAIVISVAADQVPEVVISPNPSGGTAPLDVQFTSAVLGGNAPLAYAWDFGDGGTATVAQPAHTFAAAGTYLVVLIVTDVDGDVGWDWREITVGP